MKEEEIETQIVALIAKRGPCEMSVLWREVKSDSILQVIERAFDMAERGALWRIDVSEDHAILGLPDDPKPDDPLAYLGLTRIESEQGSILAPINMMEEKPLTGLWRRNPDTPEGKYLVKRRDGSVVEWPNLVMGAKDPAAPAGIRAYADEAERLGYNTQYVEDMRWLADVFEMYRAAHGNGDPDRGRHREDDPATIAEMRGALGS